MLVVDASTTLEWFLPAQMSSSAAAALKIVRRSWIVVPSIWVFETQNAILKMVRQRRLSSAEAQEARLELSLIGARAAAPPDGEAVGRIWEISVHQMMSFYDASYVELAWHLKLPLASSDGAIRAAAARLGIRLV
ncbi:MAG TPA: type II toxin-antitoxin system VapC family toxin [Phycisphaerae bacterium]|nr:type II toxin-antitoxin system VapC family toxin [Phycisphaerae bacterium]